MQLDREQELKGKNSEQVLNILNRAFLVKYNSLAYYITQARPYLKPGQEVLLKEVDRIAAEDKALTTDIVRAIEDLSGVVSVEPYNHKIAELNYLSLDYLVKVLLEHLKEELEQLKADIKNLTEDTAPYHLCEKVARVTGWQYDRLLSKQRSFASSMES